MRGKGQSDILETIPSILILGENEIDTFVLKRMFELSGFQALFKWEPGIEKGVEYLDRKYDRQEQMADLIMLNLDKPLACLTGFMKQFVNVYRRQENPPILVGLSAFAESPLLKDVYRFDVFSRVQNRPVSEADVKFIEAMICEEKVNSGNDTY